jgi:hypothetical protein
VLRLGMVVVASRIEHQRQERKPSDVRPSHHGRAGRYNSLRPVRRNRRQSSRARASRRTSPTCPSYCALSNRSWARAPHERAPAGWVRRHRPLRSNVRCESVWSRAKNGEAIFCFSRHQAGTNPALDGYQSLTAPSVLRIGRSMRSAERAPSDGGDAPHSACCSGANLGKQGGQLCLEAKQKVRLSTNG